MNCQRCKKQPHEIIELSKLLMLDCPYLTWWSIAFVNTIKSLANILHASFEQDIKVWYHQDGNTNNHIDRSDLSLKGIIDNIPIELWRIINKNYYFTCFSSHLLFVDNHALNVFEILHHCSDNNCFQKIISDPGIYLAHPNKTFREIAKAFSSCRK